MCVHVYICGFVCVGVRVCAQVIKGWDEGVIKMSLGEAATIKCSSDYAYGDAGMPPVIPAKSELIFEVCVCVRVCVCVSINP